MSKRLLILIAASLLAITGVAIAAYWAAGGPDRRLPSCSDLPQLSAAQDALAANEDTVANLEDLPDAKGAVSLRAYSPEKCPGKGVISITYDNVTTRKEIRDKLGATFHGVPYTLSNV